MEGFNFIEDREALNYRSVFANDICQLLVDKNYGDISKALSQLKPIYDGLFECVDNIYELVDSEIPLVSLYRLYDLGADNWGFEKHEYKEAIEKTKKACKEYYGK